MFRNSDGNHDNRYAIDLFKDVICLLKVLSERQILEFRTVKKDVASISVPPFSI